MDLIDLALIAGLTLLQPEEKRIKTLGTLLLLMAVIELARQLLA